MGSTWKSIPFLQEMLHRVLQNHRQKELGGNVVFHFIGEETAVERGLCIGSRELISSEDLNLT